jgi:hypothetical protein
MKQVRVVMFLVALVLPWSGAAMAQDATSLHTAATNKCLNADEDPIFKTGNTAKASLLGFWPYFPKKDSNWWNGIVVGNTSETDTIGKDELCLVGVTADGEEVASWYSQPIYPQHSKAFLKESISSSEEWEESVYMGVYAKNANDKPEAFAFGLLGSKTGAGAAGAEFVPEDVNTITDNAADSLYFAYMPGGKWWSAIVLVNFFPDDAEVDVEIVHSDGTVKEVKEVKVGKGSMLALTPAVLNELADDEDDPTKWDESKTAYVSVTGAAGLAGWAQFGNGKSSVGYVGGIKQAPAD